MSGIFYLKGAVYTEPFYGNLLEGKQLEVSHTFFESIFSTYFLTTTPFSVPSAA